jgi:transcriptional regulator with XRE-family HTH domain
MFLLKCQDMDEWASVASAINERMEIIPIDQATLARRAGLSDAFVRSMMKGEPRGEPRDLNLRKLAVALGWRADAFDRLRAGGQPVEVSLRNGDEVDALRADILDTRRQLAALLESRDGGLNPEQEAIAELAVASIEQLRVQVTGLVAEILRLSAAQDATSARLDALESPGRSNHA